MSRRRTSHSDGHKSSFSFLDTLICTMGVLLVLLHAFARHGEVKISKEMAEKAAREAENAGPELEGIQWDIEQLQAARAKTEQQLIEEGQKLSHIEDHQRRLRERFHQLRIAVAEMERLDPKAKRQQELDELAALQAKIRDAKQAVDEARKKSEQAATYSVVPYEGPNSTRRRPIYIECRGDAIVLQPEGVVLNPEDFAGFTGPGNPLASALRSMQEYWSRQAPGTKQAEPYPLLLVRPEGIEGYYVARAALDTWGSEFGYELIGSDWQLAFPEPDPQLAEVTKQVVADARGRQREYLASTAQLSRNRSRPTYRASPRGGFVQERGSGSGGRAPGGGGGWDDPGSNWTRRGGSSIAGRGTGGGVVSNPGQWGGGATGSDAGTGQSNLRGAADGTALNDSPGGDSLDGIGTAKTKGGGKSGGGTDRYGRPLDGSGGEGEGTSSDGSLLAGADGSPGSRGDSPPQAGSQSPSGSKMAGSRSATGSPGGSASSSDASSQASAGSRGGSSSSSSSGSAGGGSAAQQAVSAGTPNFDPTSSVQAKKTVSMSKTRGRDWGLPDGGASRESAASRPIMVECHNDRLVIVPESKNQLPKEVRMQGKTQDSMDEFVSDVWQHMKGWGTAGRGLYWRPTLVMDVKPGAADRYAEVKALLADSGLEVHERQTSTTATSPSKKNRK